MGFGYRLKLATVENGGYFTHKSHVVANVCRALAKRGHEIWKARTAIEITVVVVGFFLGGTLGAGTVWFAVSIGPFVQFFLRRLTFLPALST